MKVRDVITKLKDRGAAHVRTSGSHRRFDSSCGRCHTTVSGHLGEDVPAGTLRKIQRDMSACYGPKWLGV